MSRLRHIAITVPDPWKAAEFYMQAFGLRKVGEADSATARGVYLTDGVVNLALLNYRTDSAAGEERGRDWIGVHHIGFWVDDVEQTRRAIEAAGGRHFMGEVATDAGAFYEVKFRDPDGVIFDTTANGWGGAVKDPAGPSDAPPSRAHD